VAQPDAVVEKPSTVKPVISNAVDIRIIGVRGSTTTCRRSVPRFGKMRTSGSAIALCGSLSGCVMCRAAAPRAYSL